MPHFFNLVYLARGRLDIHQEIDLTLREILKQKRKPTLIRLSRKASIKYCLEDGHERISEGAKYHLLWNKCLVELKYNDSMTKWISIECEF
jgi:hypothetical protein